MTWQALLIPLALLLVILVVVLVFIPAYLERLSRVNLVKRSDYRHSTKELSREERRLERLLTPYRRAKSDIYRLAVGHVDGQLAQINAHLSDIDRLIELLTCPELFDYLFPVQHFAIAPGHIKAILVDSQILKRIKLQLDATSSGLAKVQEAFDHLANMPARLQSQRGGLLQRLASIEENMARAQNEGIGAMDDFVRDVTAVRNLLGEAIPENQTQGAVQELDAVALALQQAEAILSETEVRAAELDRERVALDRRIRRAATELDHIQATAKSGPNTDMLPQIRPMMRRAAALLNESAQAHRSRREFNAAGADVTTAIQLITFARDLQTANEKIHLLIERDDGLSLAAPISALKKELTELLSRVESDGMNGSSALADAALGGRAARVRTRAETLARQQDDMIAELIREAALAKERLDHVWMTGQNLLTLAPEDSLTRRYANLEARYGEAMLKPAALEQYRHDVTAFEVVLDAWVTRIQATHALIRRMRAGMLDLIDQALDISGPWACLVEDVKFIQQRAVDFETLQTSFYNSRLRRETESIMDQLQTVEGDITDRLERLRERATRLAYLESDVSQILELATGDNAELPVDHPERLRLDRAIRLIDHHVRSAHTAGHYEDASVALLRAADAANKLAL